MSNVLSLGNNSDAAQHVRISVFCELEILKQRLIPRDYEKVEAKTLAQARIIEIKYCKQQVEDCVVQLSEKENLIAEVLKSQSKIKHKNECKEYSQLLRRTDEAAKQLFFITGWLSESEEKKQFAVTAHQKCSETLSCKCFFQTSSSRKQRFNRRVTGV